MARTDIASAFINASLDQVYAALVDPAALATWLPPTGMTGRFEHFDLREEGGYRMVLTYLEPESARPKSGADSDVVQVRFIRIIPDELIVQEIDFLSDDPAFAGTMTMTWEITPLAGGCVVTITARDVPEGITAQQHVAGMKSSLAQLGEYLELPEARKAR